MPASQPAAGDDFPGGGSNDAWPPPGADSSGPSLDDLSYPGWRFGDFANGRGVLGVVPPPDHDAVAQAARAAVSRYVNQGIAQQLLIAPPPAPALGPWSSSSRPPAGSPPPPTAPADNSFWGSFGSGYVNDFKDLYGRLVRSAQEQVRDPVGSTLRNAVQALAYSPVLEMNRNVQRMDAQVGNLLQGYKTAAANGTQSSFWGDTAGHAAAKLTPAVIGGLVGKGAGLLLDGAPELAPEALEAGTPETIIQRGGAYRDVRGIPGYEAHHMPAKAVSPLAPRESPAIAMTKADHKGTMSWGRADEATAHREKQTGLIQQGDFHSAQQMDIDDIREKFGKKYDAAIQQMQAYTDSRIQK